MERLFLTAIVTAAVVAASACGVGSATDPDGAVSDTTVSSAATESQGPRVEELRFTSDGFEVVGDLVLPGSQGPYPAVIVVHGDGPQTRNSTPGTRIVRDEFGAAGVAVFSWDKPGSGESTGEFDQGETLRQRAAILADGIGLLADHPAIDADRIGLWGLSQAGWVMPLALERSDGVAFMIVVSGGAEDSIEQLGYQLGQDHVCRGGAPEEGDLIATHFPQASKGPSYNDYVAAMEILMEIEGWERFIGPEFKTRSEWRPWPSDIDAYFDPVTVIERTTIPVLAVFGELDRYVDPIQGANAYDVALGKAGNPNYRVELLPGVGHTMQTQSTMCGGVDSASERYRRLLVDWIATLDFTHDESQ